MSTKNNRAQSYTTVLVCLCTLMFMVGCNVLGGQHPASTTSSAVAKHKTMATSNVEVEPAKVETTPTKAESKATVAALESECEQRMKQSKKFFVTTESDNKSPFVKVGASGYGAPPKNYYPEGQRRLMTIRASKIDAYRSLAEIVGGLHIWGGTSIGDMVLERDRYRVFIDTYVRGARIVSVTGLEDDTYKTIVEMHVDQRFLSQVMAFIDPLLAKCLKDTDDGNFAMYGNGNSGLAPSFYYSE